jgi:hypothetical protein
LCCDVLSTAHLLSVKDPATGLPLTHSQLKAEISIFMAAGFETTSHAITWTMAALAAHPEVQEKVYLELAALGLAPVSASSSSSGAAAAAAADGVRDIEAADLGRLPYMQVGTEHFFGIWQVVVVHFDGVPPAQPGCCLFCELLHSAMLAHVTDASHMAHRMPCSWA